MPVVTTKELNEHREPGCWAVLADRKYFRVGNSCIKRSLRPHEWTSHRHGTAMAPPSAFPQRFKTDAAVLKYLSEKTNIPLPRLQCVFEDDGAFYHCTEFVEGVSMDELSEEDKKVVTKELLQHVATLKSLRSDTPGVPGESLLCPPERISNILWKPHVGWRPRSDVKGDFVFCHNDLGQHNILVDPKTLKINAIIDWEFGGFWPEWFEQPYWETSMSSYPLERDESEIERCREWLMSHCEEVEIPPLSTFKVKMGFQTLTPDGLRDVPLDVSSDSDGDEEDKLAGQGTN